MVQVALWQPEIPPNTGNIARSCVAVDVPLHLIGRLGFHIDDKHLRRAGMDYWEHVRLHLHTGWAEFAQVVAGSRLLCFSAHATRSYTQVEYQEGDCLVFGNESSGLPASVLAEHKERVVGIPMPTGKVRSLNLATSVGIALYEALRQIRGW